MPSGSAGVDAAVTALVVSASRASVSAPSNGRTEPSASAACAVLAKCETDRRDGAATGARTEGPAPGSASSATRGACEAFRLLLGWVATHGEPCSRTGATRDPARAGRRVRAAGPAGGRFRRGESRSLVVRGEAGIGKTALLEYLVESASDLTVVRAVGVESEMELAYASLHQLCAPLLDRLARLPAPQREALEIVFGLSAGAAAGSVSRRVGGAEPALGGGRGASAVVRRR